jgi:hypothetical protein
MGAMDIRAEKIWETKAQVSQQTMLISIVLGLH